MTRPRILGLAGVLAIAIAAGYVRYVRPHAPEGQPPLTTIDAVTLTALRDDFNNAVGKVRVIVLLSPT